MGRSGALAKPVGRVRCLRRDHQGGRRQPSTRLVPSCNGHDAPWPFDLAEHMGRTGYPPPGIEARRIGVILHPMSGEDADFRADGPAPKVV